MKAKSTLFLFALTLCQLVGVQSSNAQNGYFQDFNSVSSVPSNFTPGIPYVLSIVNQSLCIKVNKADLFSGVDLTFPTTVNLNLAANKKISFKIKTDSTTRVLPYELRMQIFSSGAQNGGRRTSKVIYPTAKWQSVSFDFNDPAFTSVNFQ